MFMSFPTVQLAQSPLFRTPLHNLSTEDRSALSYKRAAAIVRAYGLTAEDVMEQTPKYWTMHTDPMVTIDGAAGTLVTIQCNLCAGTIAAYASQQGSRGVLDDTVKRLLDYSLIGNFMLTELNHGLDVFNLETTATLLPDGKFDLHTPHSGAAKYMIVTSSEASLTVFFRWMPPTIPVGTPCIGVVFARLLVAGEDHGVRPFIVPINDGKKMCQGITARLAPPREGAQPVNHSLTSFTHVLLPNTALLGSLELDRSPSTFFNSIWRVAVGTMSVGCTTLPGIQTAVYICAKYSLKRTVVDHAGVARPIFSFRTQQIPVATALATAYVLKAYMQQATRWFCDTDLDPRSRHGVGAVLKVTAVRLVLPALFTLSERMGAQGLFAYNQISTMINTARGLSTAEGDILGLSIRLATELLLGRYELPAASHSGVLASHEAAIMAENRAILASSSGHRSSEFQRLVLPQCQKIVESIGHRMAYDAALSEGVMPCLIQLFEVSAIKHDLGWYVERGVLTRAEIRDREDRAVDEVLQHLDELLEGLHVKEYIVAPVLEKRDWDGFVRHWRVYGDQVARGLGDCQVSEEVEVLSKL